MSHATKAATTCQQLLTVYILCRSWKEGKTVFILPISTVYQKLATCLLFRSAKGRPTTPLTAVCTGY